MSVDDLTSAFHSLNQRLDREERWAAMIHSVVDENATLLTQTISECQVLARTIKTNDEAAAASSLKLTGEVRAAMSSLEDADKQRDIVLRAELDSMTTALEAGHRKLETMISAVAATAGLSSSSSGQWSEPRKPRRSGEWPSTANRARRARSAVSIST